MTTGLIFDIKKFSIHDGPGIRTTVFFKGCPLGCLWCHNPESQLSQPEVMLREKRCIQCGACLQVCANGAVVLDDGIPSIDRDACALCGACIEACYAEAREMVGHEMAVARVMEEIERDIVFYEESGGGATFSGGEPLLQFDFLRELLQACREAGIHTAVDTCGYASWETIDAIRRMVDLFLYDLKLMDDDRHIAFTGVSNSLILQNLKKLSELGHELVIRVVTIPGINDDPESMRQLAEFVASLPRAHRIDILPYHRAGTDKYERLGKAYELSGVVPPSAERVAEMVGVLARYGLEVKVGG